MNKHTFLNDSLKQIAAPYFKNYGVRIFSTKHFFQRFNERYENNFNRGVIELLECIDKNVCLVIYYINLDTILPERGRIDFHDYEIRCNVIDGALVLSTFVKK